MSTQLAQSSKHLIWKFAKEFSFFNSETMVVLQGVDC